MERIYKIGKLRPRNIIGILVLGFSFLSQAQVRSGFEGQSFSFSPAKYFQPGVEYFYKAGTRGFGGGKVKIEQKNDILYFTAKIRFLGAGTFSRTNLQEVLSISQPQIKPSPEFFGKNLDSFSDNQLLVLKINELVKVIEQSFESPHVHLKIIPEFGKDSDYLSLGKRKIEDYKSYLVNLRNSVDEKHSSKKTDSIPISIVARPEADRASPSEWDLYSDPRLFAHEFFHVIGSLFEGYECNIYPPNGIMQDGTMMEAVDQFGQGQKAAVLLPSDLLELLSSGFSSAKQINPEPEQLEELDALIESHASSAICIRHGDGSRSDYLQWPVDRRAEDAQKRVSNWLRSSRN